MEGLLVDLLGLRDHEINSLFVIIIVDAPLAIAVLSASLIVLETRAVQPNAVAFGALASPLLAADVYRGIGDHDGELLFC